MPLVALQDHVGTTYPVQPAALGALGFLAAPLPHEGETVAVGGVLYPATLKATNPKLGYWTLTVQAGKPVYVSEKPDKNGKQVTKSPEQLNITTGIVARATARTKWVQLALSGAGLVAMGTAGWFLYKWYKSRKAAVIASKTARGAS